MKQYLTLLRNVLENGTPHKNRTGIDTRRVLGAMLEFDLARGFPAMTTKKLAFGQVKGELIGFIRGCTSAKQFRELGCKVWDANANANAAWLENPNRYGHDSLGRVYGAQWRRWAGFNGHGDPIEVDQLANALREIKHNPESRRIIVNAWQPAELDQMALPPCHVLYQYHVDGDTLHMTMYQRSCDLFLGVPFNIASYALLLELTAKATRLTPGRLVMFLADVHIYENHVDQVREQLSRAPLPLPELKVNDSPLTGIEFLNNIRPEDIGLNLYVHQGALPAPMAV